MPAAKSLLAAPRSRPCRPTRSSPDGSTTTSAAPATTRSKPANPKIRTGPTICGSQAKATAAPTAASTPKPALPAPNFGSHPTVPRVASGLPLAPPWPAPRPARRRPQTRRLTIAIRGSLEAPRAERGNERQCRSCLPPVEARPQASDAHSASITGAAQRTVASHFNNADRARRVRRDRWRRWRSGPKDCAASCRANSDCRPNVAAPALNGRRYPTRAAHKAGARR